MELVKQSAEILTINGRSLENFDETKLLRYLEGIGRTCYKSEDKIGDDEKTRKFVQGIIDRGHHSVIEHIQMSVRFVTNRGTTHELVRHRLASYSQESTRYCNYGSDHVKFVIPHWTKLENGFYLVRFKNDFKWFMKIPDKKVEVSAQEFIWLSAMSEAEVNYKSLLNQKVPAQDARGVLPIDLKTEIVMTANIREWWHVFKLRTAPAAHPQIRNLMTELMAAAKSVAPVLFGTAGVLDE